MTFVDFEWVGWMAGTTAAFWLVPRPLRFATVPAITALFLGLTDPTSLSILAAITSLVCLAARWERVDGLRTILASFSIAVVLLTFKGLSAARGESLLVDTIIPLGLSFYALRCIHFLVERYKGAISRQPITDVIAYLFFLPTLYIGPIHKYPDFAKDLRRHHWDALLFSEGLERILNGYAKIAVLGNFLVSGLFGHWNSETYPPESFQYNYFRMVEIGLNLYFQFSGYSDIAIGFARVLGFRVIENFNWPYLQKNISDFWKNWHISLTSWVRGYVYTPVSAITRSPALGALATLVIIGLWHELSLLYLLWGAYHGLGIVMWQQWVKVWRWHLVPEAGPVRVAVDALKVLLTVHFVWLGFIIVRSPDVPTMLHTFRILLFGWF